VKTARIDALGLRYNPFEPAASGAPMGELWIPDRWKEQLTQLLDMVQSGQGVKAFVLEGEYGSGKTYLLKWLEQVEFPRRRIRPFFFDNPGVQFYDLANNLLRQIGRYEFSKMLWEFVKPEIGSYQQSYFENKDTFIAWLTFVKRQKKQETTTNLIATSIKNSGITNDDEIAFRLARTIIETLDKPYFEYRDFVAGKKEALVAEKEEANYFSAIIRTLSLTSNVAGVSFLLDEFEEISLQKRLGKKEAQDYLATLKRLINVTNQQEFWLVVSMTPLAAEMSNQLEPALWQRFTGRGRYQYIIPSLLETDAEELLVHRLSKAYINNDVPRLWPFPADIVSILTPVTYSSPRRLVQVAFHILAEASMRGTKGAIKPEFVHEIEEKINPSEQLQ
jgi:hypothetical protein